MTTDAQTEARAIARKIVEDYGLDADEQFVLVERIATALAAKDAELEAERDLRIDAENDRARFIEGKVLAEHQRDAARTQLAEANKALDRMVTLYESEYDPDFLPPRPVWLQEILSDRRAREQGGSDA